MASLGKECREEFRRFSGHFFTGIVAVVVLTNMSQKNKRFRVSFYNKSEIVDGRAQVHSCIQMATTPDDAKSKLADNSNTDNLVPIKAYPFYRSLKYPTRKTWIIVSGADSPATKAVLKDLSGTTSYDKHEQLVDQLAPLTPVGKNRWVRGKALAERIATLKYPTKPDEDFQAPTTPTTPVPSFDEDAPQSTSESCRWHGTRWMKHGRCTKTDQYPFDNEAPNVGPSSWTSSTSYTDGDVVESQLIGAGVRSQTNGAPIPVDTTEATTEYTPLVIAVPFTMNGQPTSFSFDAKQFIPYYEGKRVFIPTAEIDAGSSADDYTVHSDGLVLNIDAVNERLKAKEAALNDILGISEGEKQNSFLKTVDATIDETASIPGEKCGDSECGYCYPKSEPITPDFSGNEEGDSADEEVVPLTVRQWLVPGLCAVLLAVAIAACAQPKIARWLVQLLLPH